MQLKGDVLIAATIIGGLILFDLKKKIPLFTFESQDQTLSALIVDPDFQWVLFGGFLGYLNFLDLNTLDLNAFNPSNKDLFKVALNAEDLACMHLDHNSRMLITCNVERSVQKHTFAV